MSKSTTLKGAAKKATAILAERGYREVVAVGGQNSDWAVNTFGEDSDVWQNIFLLRARCRDLFRTNGVMSKYREELAANVMGEHGIMLRMKCKETEDRVIHAADEKWAHVLHQRRIEKVLEWVAGKTSNRVSELLRHRERMSAFERATAKVKVGEPDVYANQLIERRWKEWKAAQFADVCGRRSYLEIQQLRLWTAVRDGDFFLRTIKDPAVNKFGFALQMVNPEWCDYFYNANLANGNEVRMGIEYQRTAWGIRRPVAYHFLKRQPNDWQFTIPGAFNFSAGNLHDRIDASEIIHYARYVDAESTRPAPWIANVIPKSRQLDQFELAEVIAARAAACKTGWLESNVNPDGGDGFIKPDPTGVRNLETEAGGIYGLPWGITYKDSNPLHPNGDAPEFRKMMLRSMCAGMPGANYNIIANDAEGVSYSTGRIFSLDDRELWKLIQRWDIEKAERPIFESWLQMSLITGAVPLPLAKFAKFNAPHFSGRRWQWVDPAKDAKSVKERLLLGLTSRSRECDEQGVDFDDVLFELAEEEMLIAELGLNAISLDTISGAKLETEPDEDETEDDSEQSINGKKPVEKNRIAAITNGTH